MSLTPARRNWSFRDACSGRPQPLTCSVSHPAHRTLENTLEFGRAGIQRDEAGGWRAAIGLHLA